MIIMDVIVLEQLCPEPCTTAIIWRYNYMMVEPNIMVENSSMSIFFLSTIQQISFHILIQICKLNLLAHWFQHHLPQI